MRTIGLLLTLFFCLSSDATKSDLLVLNIDGIGPEKLQQLKSMPELEWWVEMGSGLLVSLKENSATNFPTGVYKEKILKDIKLEDLAVHVPGHCNHTEKEGLFHRHLKEVYAGQMSRIVDIGQVTDKNGLFAHDSILPLEKNKVLTYQLKNRSYEITPKSSQVQMLVDQVDKDRWYSQVEYLANHDRMLEADLNTTGDWLEGKFSALGLATTRLTLHNYYRGTNVLGFKKGTTLAEDLYVVGAHMDSRNSNWDDNAPSPGAEDNASGCSGVLEVANIISQYETEASIYFMCFIEEESGLLGSKDVVTQFQNDGLIGDIKAMLNMDMISYRAPNQNTATAGTNSSNFQTLANTVAANGNQYTDINWQVSLNMCCTDFVSFANKGVPAVTSNQPDIWNYFGYHSTQDLAVNLDPELGAGIVKANLATLIGMVGVDFLSGDLIFADAFEKP